MREGERGGERETERERQNEREREEVTSKGRDRVMRVWVYHSFLNYVGFPIFILFLITLAHFDPPSSFGDSVEVVPGIYMFLLPAFHYVVLRKSPWHYIFASFMLSSEEECES